MPHKLLSTSVADPQNIKQNQSTYVVAIRPPMRSAPRVLSKLKGSADPTADEELESDIC
jgi:hypothetical protein